MNISEVCQDKGSGTLSASRFVLLLWCTGVFAIRAYSSIITHAISALPESVVTILGIVITGKTAQRFGEEPTSPPGQGRSCHRVAFRAGMPFMLWLFPHLSHASLSAGGEQWLSRRQFPCG